MSQEETKNTVGVGVYSFDNPLFEMELNVSQDSAIEKLISARMLKPQTTHLIKREGMLTTEIREANGNEDAFFIEESKANAYLFDRVVTEIKGMRLRGEGVEVVREFRETNETLLDAIPYLWKASFIRNGMYLGTAKVVEDIEEGVVIGGDATIHVRYFVGYEDEPSFVLDFFVPEPSESEILKFNDDESQLRQPKGLKRSRSKIVSNIQASIVIFDTLMSRSGAGIEGGTVGGKTFAEAGSNPLTRLTFIESIDAVIKQRVVKTAMSRYNAKKSD